MRVLYLCHRVPYPPNKGDKIRAFHQLRGIAARHEVDLFTLADHHHDPKDEIALRQYCSRMTVARLQPARSQLRMLAQLLTHRPLSLAYFYSAELHGEIRRALLRRSYDRIFVFCSSMAQYVDWVDDVPALVDIVDVDSDKWMQYAAVKRFPLSAVYRREWHKLREYERKLYGKFPVLVTTEREAELVRRASDQARVQVIPNGIDATYFDPVQSATVSEQPTVIFVGDMAYFPNEEAVKFFALKVLPSIRTVLPKIRFFIVGRDPGRNVRRLQNIPGVIVTGAVPDIRPYLAKAQVSVAPFSIATGIQNKILEAMAYALPVVATPRAQQGLSKRVAEMVEVGQNAQELAACIVRLLRNPQLARQVGIEGRERVAAEYSWERSVDQLVQLLEAHKMAAIPRGEAFSRAKAGAR